MMIKYGMAISVNKTEENAIEINLTIYCKNNVTLTFMIIMRANPSVT